MPFPKASAPGADMRIHGRTDWGAAGRIHALDDRQYRDPQACPREGRGGSNSVRLRDCPELPIRNARCSAPRRSAGSPKAGMRSALGTWWRSRP